jgi:hypothetical protein
MNLSTTKLGKKLPSTKLSPTGSSSSSSRVETSAPLKANLNLSHILWQSKLKLSSKE